MPIHLSGSGSLYCTAVESTNSSSMTPFARVQSRALMAEKHAPGSSRGVRLVLVLHHHLLDHLDVLPLGGDRQPQPSEQTHVDVRDPDDRESGDEVAAPVVQDQSEV